MSIPNLEKKSCLTFHLLVQQQYSLMIIREYATLFLVGSCFLLDYSSQIPLQALLQSRTKAGVMSARGGNGDKTVRASFEEVTSLVSRTSLRRHGRSRVQRIKRGWVWNQFFVLEEYMGSEPQYVGKLHTDMDNGDNAVKYTLSGEGAGSIFAIDQFTGDIHALVGLDREVKSYYTLKAQAVDIYTGLPLEPQSEFIVKVQDINDNEPCFPDGPYSASVPEMSPTGTYVTQVTATDADDPTYGNSARIVYSILHGQPYFSVDPKTGIIRTALANMDREVKGEYQVLLQAKDMGGQMGGLASTTTINITLSDVNDNPPRFAKSIFHLRVPESASVGSAVGQIRAHDQDAGSNADVDYAIVPGDEGNMFDIISNSQSQEGVVVLKKTLDYETKKSYTFKVEVSNAQLDRRFLHLGPFKDSATVKVNVLDMDEPPVFTKPSYSMDVFEDTPPGTIIGSVTAQDLDASSSAVRYSLEWQTESDSCFDIDTVEGTISTNEYLDRETAVQHNISVVATKVNNPLLYTKVSVTVNVLDVNEFPPELAVPSDTYVCENARVGQVIQTVSAVDKDLSPVGQRFFFKSPKELHNRNFTVRDFGNNTAGIVSRRTSFQQRLQDVYVLPVVVEDSGYPAQSSTATLIIRVCACAGGGSLLSCSAEAIFLPVGLSTGALMAILLCVALLIVMAALYMGQRRHKEKDTLMTSKEDIRDNVIHYDDEGGGEADTRAFNMGTLRNTHSQRTSTHSSSSKKEKNGYGDGVLLHLSSRCDDVRSPDIHRETAGVIAGVNNKHKVTEGDAEMMREFIAQRLEESQQGYAAPPYDSLATYAYEGDGSVAGSLSSIEGSWVIDDSGDFSSLGDWGQPSKTLASILDRQPPSLTKES
ncbi:cadherin-12-like [Anoplopoma fimbria]|uniref:cadherin-12-like n=1 Tax=Anoplopoma fimbria TaxID=229290 RepID=UPI0023EDA3AA|nr:cadherin-12-like [Anoplopoma fimbria]XP_054458096.1 cadherin-12-like [Anoplopoma fimbria]XP_054458097.1 cadherin-12-like [Anoplopoma fimbria]